MEADLTMRGEVLSITGQPEHRQLIFNATNLSDIIFQVGDKGYVIDFEKLVEDYGKELL